MRAAVLHAVDEPMKIEELELEAPRAGEVSVRLLAAGVCHSDLHRARGDWGVPGLVVLGHEGAGVVEAVGEGVTSIARGQKAILNWNYPCLDCAACRQERQWLCRGTRATEHLQPDGTTRLHRADGTDVLAYLTVGAFAEATVVPAQAAIPVDGSVPPEVACLIGCCVSTGVGAVVNTAEVSPGSSVAVVGLGGVGLSVLMGARLAGARTIVAVDKSEEKLQLARELGATDVVPAGEPRTTRAAIVAATDGGADFAFEAVGLRSTIELTLTSIGRGGTAVLVGLTALDTPISFDGYRLVDLSQRILGSLYGSCNPSTDFPRFVDLYLAGELPVDRLIEARIALEDVNDALDALERGIGRRRVITF
ncbi:MAG: zinc-binding dehydrogenase [Actinomycetota bacterium]